MSAHTILRLVLAGTMLVSASACADVAGHDPREISAVPAPVPRERATVSQLAPATGAETSPDPASKPQLSAAAVPTSAHQNALTVFGQLATTQALIVSLLVAPFATTKDDPNTARDSRVPR